MRARKAKHARAARLTEREARGFGGFCQLWAPEQFFEDISARNVQNSIFLNAENIKRVTLIMRAQRAKSAHWTECEASSAKSKA